MFFTKSTCKSLTYTYSCCVKLDILKVSCSLDFKELDFLFFTVLLVTAMGLLQIYAVAVAFSLVTPSGK